MFLKKLVNELSIPPLDFYYYLANERKAFDYDSIFSACLERFYSWQLFVDFVSVLKRSWGIALPTTEWQTIELYEAGIGYKTEGGTDP